MQSNSAVRHNFPTVSSPDAMRQFSRARINERDTLLEYVRLKPGMRVLDIQSAGGFLSDEVYRRLHGRVTAICVEPNPELRARLNPVYTILDNPVERFHGIEDQSIDVALGLVGLHHSESHLDTLSESFRVLKPGGELAICDVPEGSRLADWLNVFANTHCPSGHLGNFPAQGDIHRLCGECGFDRVVEELRDVPWMFDRREDIASFFKGLFGLAVDTRTIDRALDDYFTIRPESGRIQVDWQLIYCHARKPR